MSASHNRNPTGKNQHKSAPSKNDPDVIDALKKYHREGINSPKTMQKRLLAELGQVVSTASIKRRRNELELYGPRSGVQKALLSQQDTEQIVLNQLDRDPSKGQGLKTIKNQIAFHQNIQLPRDVITKVMHMHDAAGFQVREPGAKKIIRSANLAVGIHERWAGDGHDKLYKIGFPVWAVVDTATAKWLGGWVVPSNRLGDIIVYLFLCLVLTYKGIPVQFSSDCGSETTQLYGLVNALRELFATDCDPDVVRAYEYLRSIHNIAIERSWLRLKLNFGNNAVIEYQKGPPSVHFDAENPLQCQLSQWLWAKTLQLALDQFMATSNAMPMRKDNDKAGVSGVSRNEAFFLHKDFGLTNELLPLNDDQLKIISELKDAVGGEELLAFATPEFSERAEVVYASLGVASLTMENAWHVFEAMLPLLADN